MNRVKKAVLASIVVLSACSGCGRNKNETSSNSLRLGWQVPWATQGQIVQALKRTDVSSEEGIAIEFVGFSYGGPLNEAAIAKEVDLLLTADQPAAALIAKDPNWTIVGRLMYNRVAIYVPPDSPVTNLGDLRGKTVAMPFGAAAQRVAVQAIQEFGLNPNTDYKSINLDIYEQTGLVQTSAQGRWGKIDALVGFDPTPAIFEHEKLARMVHVGKVVSVIVASNETLESDPKMIESFLRAFMKATLFYAQNQPTANRWFQEESRLSFDSRILDLCASVEPNVMADQIEDLQLILNDQDLDTLQNAADFLFEQKMVTRHVSMREHIDMTFAKRAIEHLTASPDEKGAREQMDP